MECRDCGSELPKGAYYCGGCGNPVGFSRPTVTLADNAGLDEVPEPSAPVERAATSAEAPAGPARRANRALCSLCMGAFPETVLSRIDGSAYCPDCSPVSARRSEPEPRPVSEPALPPTRTYRPDPVRRFGEADSSGGPRKALAVVLILLVIGAGGFAAYSFLGGTSRIDKMMLGLDTGKRPAKTLYQKYAAGERLDYSLRARMNGRMQIPSGQMLFGGSDEMTLDLEIGADISIDVNDVDSRGNADLEVGISHPELSGTIEAGGRSVPLNEMAGSFLGALEEAPMKMTVDPFGRPVGPVSDAGASPLGGLMNGEFGAMPDRPLAVGDEWTDSETMGLPGASGMGPLAISATYRVEGYKKVRGRECMVISVVGELGGNGSPSLSGVLDLSMDMDMEGVMFFDVAAGQMEKVAMDMTFEVSADTPQGSLEMEMNFEMDLNRQ